MKIGIAFSLPSWRNSVPKFIDTDYYISPYRVFEHPTAKAVGFFARIFANTDAKKMQPGDPAGLPWLHFFSVCCTVSVYHRVPDR